MSKEKHVHKFKRLRYKSGNEIFFCTLPDCNKKMSTALALGKRSICWRCGEEFIMTEYSLRLAKPHCDGCHKSKVPWIHEPSEIEKEATKELVQALSLSERLSQTISSAQQKQKQQLEEDEI